MGAGGLETAGVGESPATSRRRRRAGFVVIACAVLGGLASLALTVTAPQMGSAVTVMTVAPDPLIPGQDSGVPGDMNRFIQTQILILAGADLRDAVAESLD